ncbi:MAG: hypothetical protein P9M07_06565 [Candidatus Aceula meridiana]|nr:hypothetical protein [Candidatus Aceula meridiana]
MTGEQVISKNIKDYNFFNFPKKLSLADYKETKSKVISYLSKQKGVVSVYTFGTSRDISCPGISDLDIAFILDEGARIDGGCFHQLPRAGNKDKYILQHGLGFGVDKFIFKNIKKVLFFPNSDLFLEWGQGIQLDSPSFNEKKFCYLSKIYKTALNLSTVFNLLELRSINILHALKCLNGNCHDIRSAQEIGINRDNWDDYVDEVLLLRREWFMFKQKEAVALLFSLLHKSLEIFRSLIEAFESFSVSEGIPSLETNEVKIFDTNFNWIILFSDMHWRDLGFSEADFCRSKALNYFPLFLKEIKRKTKTKISILPERAFILIYFYALFGSSLNQNFKSKLLFKEMPDFTLGKLPYYGEFYNRANLFSHYWSFLKENKLTRIWFPCVSFVAQPDYLSQNIKFQAWRVFSNYDKRRTLSKILNSKEFLNG